ncbi:MAG: SagB/ThcOx family dehydrogenase [Streptococcaceae bacterium]|jgi:SagB-type dehydrogenase family enzyme|nr:SagB/ThcOx family dehydrogenase [Streptococcaceae bacterium]
MKLLLPSIVLLFLLSGCTFTRSQAKSTEEMLEQMTTTVYYELPQPQKIGRISVEEALTNRRSKRNFTDEALSQNELSQILWAAYGVTNERGFRTTPSAGALYPLEIFIVIGNVEGIEDGIYRYIATENKIVQVKSGDFRRELQAVSLNQNSVGSAPIALIYTAVFARMTERYGARGKERYTYFEIGHSAQNVYLQAVSLNLGTVAVGAFNDDGVRELLRLPDGVEPRYILPVGVSHP